MPSPLALSMRPKSFDDMVGAEKLVKKIRARAAKRMPRAWMFTGQTGTGKTTLARIIALSLQCRHGEFGSPCNNCYKDRGSFDITELNMPDIGVKELREILDGCYYNPKPGSKRRVYILDEAHTMHGKAQNLMLKYTEDCPRTTNWIITTTEPHRLLRTLRRRCTGNYQVPNLDLEDVRKLVKKALRKLHCDFNESDLVERLLEKNVTSPALILNATEKYASGSDAEEAADVELGSNVDTKAISRSVFHGLWEDVAKHLSNLNPEDIPSVRAAVSGYLNAVLLGDDKFSSRADVLAESILKLNSIGDSVPAMTAVLYKVCKFFHRGKL